MPWSSADLPVLEPSPERWPLRIAAETLGPPDLNERQLRDRLRKAGVRPVGKMRVSGHDLGDSRGMRHVPLYSVTELIALYEELYERQPVNHRGAGPGRYPGGIVQSNAISELSSPGS